MNARKLHQKAGIFAGLLLFILSITGFFLNHDQWTFQYHWTLPNAMLPDAVAEADKKLFQTKTTTTRRFKLGHCGWITRLVCLAGWGEELSTYFDTSILCTELDG